MNISVAEKKKLPIGVLFVAKRNRKDRFFLASKENYFGGWRVSAVLVESGCSTHLLPILEDQLTALVAHFHPGACHKWWLGRSSGVASSSFTLNVRNVVQLVHVSLCRDMKADVKTDPGDLERLRFHLCPEDAQEICNTDKPAHAIFTSMSSNDQTTILAFATGDVTVKRRTHALLGQSVLSAYQVSTIQQQMLMVAVTTQEFRMTDWCCVQDFGDLIVSTPDNFDDLEDDDHVGDDFTTPYRDSGDVLIG